MGLWGSPARQLCQPLTRCACPQQQQQAGCQNPAAPGHGQAPKRGLWGLSLPGAVQPVTPTFHSVIAPVVNAGMRPQCYSKGAVPRRQQLASNTGSSTHPRATKPDHKKGLCELHTHTHTAHQQHTAHPHTCTHTLDAGVCQRCGDCSSTVWGGRCTCGRLQELLVQTSQLKDRYSEGALPNTQQWPPPTRSSLSHHSSTCGTTNTHQPTTAKQDAKHGSTTTPLRTHSTRSPAEFLSFAILPQKHEKITVMCVTHTAPMRLLLQPSAPTHQLRSRGL
jgi:hypothetical protein